MNDFAVNSDVMANLGIHTVLTVRFGSFAPRCVFRTERHAEVYKGCVHKCSRQLHP